LSAHRVCAVDIGSNAIRARIVEAAGKGRRALFEARYPVRLGAGVFESGEIRGSDIADTAKAFIEIAEQCRALKVVATRVVATSAMREARNRDALIAAVKDASGFDIEIISGEEEARLVAVGVGGETLRGKPGLIIDVGGGSTELTYVGPDGAVMDLVSLPLGAVRLQPMSAPTGAIEELRQHVGEILRSSSLPGLPNGSAVIGVAGAMKAILDVLGTRKRAFTRAALESVIEQVRGLGAEEISRQYSLDIRRAEILLPGMIIAEGVMRQYAIEDIRVSDRGLREGIVEELIGVCLGR